MTSPGDRQGTVGNVVVVVVVVADAAVVVDAAAVVTGALVVVARCGVAVEETGARDDGTLSVVCTEVLAHEAIRRIAPAAQVTRQSRRVTARCTW
jgi:hypothetical protein